jgi:hypothetical protein
MGRLISTTNSRGGNYFGSNYAEIAPLFSDFLARINSLLQQWVSELFERLSDSVADEMPPVSNSARVRGNRAVSLGFFGATSKARA